MDRREPSHWRIADIQQHFALEKQTAFSADAPAAPPADAKKDPTVAPGEILLKLSDPGRLPALMVEFKAAVESLGFEY